MLNPESQDRSVMDKRFIERLNANRHERLTRMLASLVGAALVIAPIAGCERSDTKPPAEPKDGSNSRDFRASRPGVESNGVPDFSSPGAALPPPVAPPELPLPAPNLAMKPKQVQQQINEARDAVEESPDDPEAVGRLAMLYQAYGFLDAAEPWYRRAIQLAPNEFRWHYLLAHVYTSRGDGQEAIEALVRSILMRPEYVPARITLANLLLNGRSLDHALKVIEDTRRYDSESPVVAYTAGMVHLARQEYDQAAEQFESVLQDHPELGGVRKVLATAYRELGREADADQLFSERAENDETPRLSDPVRAEAFRLATGFDAEVAKGLAYLQRNSPAAALEHFDRALEFDPHNAAVMLKKAQALVGLRRFSEAENLLMGIIEADQKNIDAWLQLGDVLLMRNKPLAAQPIIAMLENVDSKNLTLVGLKARYAMAVKDYDSAAAAYRVLARANPENTHVLIELANARLLMGQLDNAKRAYLRVLQIQPQESYAMYRMALVYRDEKDIEHAYEWFEKAINAKRAAPAFYQEYASTASTEGDFWRADKILRAGRKRFGRSADLQLMHAGLLAMCPDESLRDYDTALKLARQLKKIAPDNLRVIDVLAVAMAGTGERKEAVRMLEKELVEAERALLAPIDLAPQDADTSGASDSEAALGGDATNAQDRIAREEEIKQLRAHLAAIRSGEFPSETP